jgi:flagellar hook-associated protein 1 FlgK
MGTLTALLDLSQNSLEANQAAIDITSNNVANANTPGYTQQIAAWQENDTVLLSGGYQTGGGATVSAVSQRDPVLDQRVQQQTQVVSASSAESDALNTLQSTFSLSATSSATATTALGTDIDSFFGALNQLEGNPASASVRQGVLNAAGTLATDFNSAASQIAQQTAGLNQQVGSVVQQVNGLTSSIAALNLEIAAASPHADAGTLEDQRQHDLTQLSQYIGFDQIKNEDNGLTLTTANGSPLVSGGQAFQLSTSVVNGNTGVVDAEGRDITSGLSGGSLGGIVQARDHDLPQASASLDSLAYALGSAVNAQNQAGLDANGNAGVALFTLPASAPGAASTIAVATSDPNAVAAAATGEGSSGGTNAAALAGLTSTAVLNGQSASEYLAAFLTQVGSSASRVSDENTVQQASLTQLTTQQSSISSVSLDTEASDLTEYERSYDAAAKVFTIVDQLMSSALNLGVETSVS